MTTVTPATAPPTTASHPTRLARRRRGATPDSPAALSTALRTGTAPDLRRRRALIGLSLAGSALGQLVGAYQSGLVRHLPDPPGPFDSDRTDSSEYAYSRFATPDGLLMVVNYGVTAVLAGAGGQDRTERLPLVALATAAKVVADLVGAVELAREEWQENRALCAYCQVATALSAVSAVLVVPEARRAWRVWRGRA